MNERQTKAFWSKVDVKDGTTECWPWLGAKNLQGYGHVKVGSKVRGAHRVAWELCNFEIPQGYVVMHLCDNPMCCNPHHLVLGTHKANYADMALKNRGNYHKNRPAGERIHKAKLTAEVVKEIRREYAQGNVTHDNLADRYGVTQTTIGRVLKNKTWRHVA
jgi:hypothetical protein